MRTWARFWFFLSCCGLIASVAAAQERAAPDASRYLEQYVDSEDLDEAALEEIESLIEHPIDLNRASMRDLERIPGVDAEMAAQIVALRRSAGRFDTWANLESLLEADPATLEALRIFGEIRPRSQDQMVRPARRIDAYIANQLYVQHRQERGYTNAPAAESHDRRWVTRISVRNEAGLGGRLTFRRGGASVAPRIGGVVANLFDGNLVVVGGAMSAGFGSGLILARDGMRDVWQRTTGRSTIDGFAVRARASASTDGEMRGGALQFAAPGGLAVGGLYVTREVGTGQATLRGLTVEGRVGRFRGGLLALSSRTGDDASAPDDLHLLHRFSGRRWRGASVYLDASTASSRYAIEVALVAPGVAAVVFSSVRSFAKRGRMNVVFRYVPSRFPLIHGRPTVVMAPDGTGELGLNAATAWNVAGWRARFVVDVARRRWSSASAAWPATTLDVRGELSRRLAGMTTTVRASHQRSPVNRTRTEENGRPVLASGFEQRTGIRIQSDMPLTRRLSMRLRLELSGSGEADGSVGRGALLYEHIRWQPANGLLIEARNVSFSSSTSSARLYVHETDVLYQPVLSVLSGDGVRRYLKIRLDLGPHVLLEGKVGRLTRALLPTATSALPRNEHRLDVRFQIRIKPG